MFKGHTAFDLAEKDMCRLLEKLKEQQTSVSYPFFKICVL